MASAVITRSYLPQPTNCDLCGSINVAFATNDVIYNGVKKGEWPWCYYCIDCKASVGCHPNTAHPLGTMADKATKMHRTLAHFEFDKLWMGDERIMGRTAAYQWLADCLNIQFEDCHMGQLTLEQLKQTIELVRTNYETLKRISIRKQQRKQNRFFKRVERQKRRSGHSES